MFIGAGYYTNLKTSQGERWRSDTAAANFQEQLQLKQWDYFEINDTFVNENCQLEYKILEYLDMSKKTPQICAATEAEDGASVFSMTYSLRLRPT